MNYYKRQWDESTGDELTDSWGKSTLYFETDHDNFVVRQIQVFENGKQLKYSTEFIQDKYGSLSDQPIDIDDFESFAIVKSEFEKFWTNDNKND